MERVVLCTSSSGLDYLDKPENVRVLRHHIEINGETYPEGDHDSYQDLADRMIADKNFMPVTAPQEVDELLQVFEDLCEDGVREVFVVTVSSTVSDAYDNVVKAKKLFNKQMFIHVYDSKTIAHSEAVLALEAARMMDTGVSAKEIYTRLDLLRENSLFWMSVDDLSYFVKRKRLSAPAGFVANVFNIKPVLELDSDGYIEPIERVRKIDKALELMCDYGMDALSESSGRLYLVNFGNRELLEKVQRLLEEAGLKNIPVYLTSPATLANLGPHGVGLGVMLDC